MKKKFWWGVRLCCAAMMILCMGSVARADGETIKEGIYAGSDSLGGLTVQEADAMIREKIAKMGDSHVTLVVAGGHEVTIEAGSSGLILRSLKRRPSWEPGET